MRNTYVTRQATPMGTESRHIYEERDSGSMQPLIRQLFVQIPLIQENLAEFGKMLKTLTPIPIKGRNRTIKKTKRNIP